MAVDPWTLLLYVGIAIGALVVLYIAILIVLSATKLTQVKEQTQELPGDSRDNRGADETIRNVSNSKKDRKSPGKAKHV